MPHADSDTHADAPPPAQPVLASAAHRAWLFGLPLAAALVGLIVWRQVGFEPLNRAELGLVAWVNGLTGRIAAFDHVVIFLNRWWGEALTVVIIFSAYCIVVRRMSGPQLDWRPVAVFAGYIFVAWFAANTIADHLIVPNLPRTSPSLLLPDETFVDLEELYETRVKTVSSNAFPSNHGTVFFTVFFMVLFRWGRPAWALLPLCVVLSMPRVFTGAHWMSDTLIGSVLVTWFISAVAIHTPLFRLCDAAERWSLTFPPSMPQGVRP